MYVLISYDHIFKEKPQQDIDHSKAKRKKDLI